MKRLSIDGINSLPDVPTKEVDIEEWDVSIVLKGMTKSMQVELGKLLEDDKLDAFDYQKKLLVACVLEPELTEEDVDKLYEKDSSVIDNIFLEINELNGIGVSADAEQFSDES